VEGGVVTVNVALVAPAATVTLAGTEADAGALLESVTAKPAAPAADVSVTVPWDVEPALMLAGASATEDSATTGTVTVSVALRVVPPNEPLIAAVLVAAGEPAVTVNVALVAPAATVTLAGTVATAVFALESVTTAPPAGAAALSVAVPVEVPSRATDVGASAIVASDTPAGGTTPPALMLSEALRVLPLSVALMFARVATVTAVVFTVNVARLAPAATATEAGTVAAALLLESATDAPPAGAAWVRVTVPVDVAPPVTVVGVSETDAGCARLTPFWNAPALRLETVTGAVERLLWPQAPRFRSTPRASIAWTATRSDLGRVSTTKPPP
jgi:hypothetical protein